jgi:hypothetical protein
MEEASNEMGANDDGVEMHTTGKKQKKQLFPH